MNSETVYSIDYEKLKTFTFSTAFINQVLCAIIKTFIDPSYLYGSNSDTGKKILSQ